MPTPKKRPAKKAAAKRRPARRSNSRRGGKRKAKGPSPGILLFLLVVSLACLGVSVFMLIEEKTEDPATSDLDRKAQELARDHPDAEVFNLTEPVKKKALIKESTPPTTRKPKPPPKPKTAERSEVPTPTDVSKPDPEPVAPPVSVVPKPPPPPSPPEPPREVRRAERIVGPAPASQIEVAAWQIRLERWHFSMGTIDGDYGMRSRRAVTQFQKHHGLPVTGELDYQTRYKLGMPGNPFMLYTVTDGDMNQVQPTPDLWLEKAKQEYLGYADGWEMIAEKFHSTVGFMQRLNPSVDQISAGTVLTAPQLEPSLPLPKIDRIKIILSETTLLTFKGDQVMSCFPCSIARNKNKRPAGELRVKNIAPNPNYTFNPSLFPEVSANEGITRRMIIPPGPNNPVGLAWVGLTLPGYGIHGTPEPTHISRTGSSGCFRLANWNAQKLLRMVTTGIPVAIVE